MTALLTEGSVLDGRQRVPAELGTGVRSILIVDDHAVVRMALRELFATSGDMAVVAEAATGQDALYLLRTRSFDGALLDLSLPDRSGIDILRRARIVCPAMRVVVYSMHSAEQYAASVMRAGASGYLMKGSDTAEVLIAMRTTLAGDPYLDPSLRSSSRAREVVARSGHKALSTREFEVFFKLAKGLPLAAVADQMHLSLKTISTHRTNILSKMGLRTNSDLTYYAIKNDLIE